MELWGFPKGVLAWTETAKSAGRAPYRKTAAVPMKLWGFPKGTFPKVPFGW